MTTPVQILERTKALLQDPGHWVQKNYAVDSMGHRVASQSPEAVRWCVRGGLGRCGSGYGVYAFGAASHYLDRAAVTLYPSRDAVDVNDIIGHPAVMTMLDLAIQLAKANEPKPVFDVIIPDVPDVPVVEEVEAEAPEPKVLIEA